MAESQDELSNIAESLKSLGLTKYEALVYIAMLKVAGATATEIHEISGVPRASVYPVLDRLIQKNLVSVSNTSPKRFDAMPPEEGISNLLTSIEANAQEAKKVLADIFSQRIGVERGTQELIWSIYGLENIHIRISDLIRQAKQDIRIFSSMQFFTPGMIEALEAAGEKVTIEVIIDQWPGTAPRNIRLLIKKPPIGHEIGNKTVAGGVFLFDCNRVMVIMGPQDEGLTGLYSESDGFVRFFSSYWRFFKEWARKEENSDVAAKTTNREINIR
jgi:HTH-type transcriptional regulator, sugar sensing transcriptional regulator